MNAYWLLLLVCLLTCAGQLCQKQAANQRGKIAQRSVLSWLVIAALLLGVALLLWLVVLQRLPLSVAYPMLSLNFAGVALAAHLIFSESLTLRQWCGVLLIVLGIALMGIEV